MTPRRLSLVMGAMAAVLLTAGPGLSAQDDDAPLPQRPKAGQTKAMSGQSAPLSEDEKISHFLNRFTPGATQALLAEVREDGIPAWLDKQAKGDLQESEWFFNYLKKLTTIGMSRKEVVDKFRKENQNELQAVPGQELQAYILARAVYSNRHLREVSSDFFRNHFSISLEKDEVKFLAPDWEIEVIRVNALGSFGDMLAASARHPAMLIYLDNHISRSPPSPGEIKAIENRVLRETKDPQAAKLAGIAARQEGLNENYARELMELHTLGVDRFYTQEDVVSLAKILTGWTIDRNDWSFKFDKSLHCTEKKQFLRGAISNKAGTTEGDFILEFLKHHPGTAQFLSWKLCRYLVNDEPDAAMVKRVAGVWRSSKGDLPKVYKAIASDPEFFQRRNFRDKYKRPWEFVVSTLRATGAVVEDWKAVVDSLAKMNEEPYRCQDPTGYYDQAEAWRDPGAIANRWVFAVRVVANQVPGIRVPDTLYKDLPDDKPEQWMDLMIAKILPGAGISEGTYHKLKAMLEKELAGKPSKQALGTKIAGILLGSPDFQKQ